MEEAVTLTPERRPRSRNQHDAFDAALIRAKRDKRRVGLILAVNTWYSDEDGYCTALVEHVSRFAVLFKIVRPNGHAEQWISKVHLVSVGEPE